MIAPLRMGECFGIGVHAVSPRRPVLCGSRCSGPVPWKTDGRWYSGRHRRAVAPPRARSEYLPHYDIHAAID
jgi:hypothetical protein